MSGQLDGARGLVSYLTFSSLWRYAPRLARRAEALGRLWRGQSWLSGESETEAGPITIAHLGPPDRYARWLLARLGLSSIRAERAKPRAGSVPCGVELIVIPAHEAREWGREGWLVLPRFVRHRQALGSEPSKFENRVAERCRARGVRLRLSRDPDELDRFQRELYEPMLRRRHGDQALRTGRALLRFGQRRGGLFVAESEGRLLAAAVGAPSVIAPSELAIWALGVAADAPSGSGLAPVLGWVRWARERDFDAVDHLLGLPLYTDGLTRQKLRWGTELMEFTERQERIAMRLHASGPALTSWLSRHTFAACSSAGIVPVSATDRLTIAQTARALVDA
jgi:hypothetical protein